MNQAPSLLSLALLLGCAGNHDESGVTGSECGDVDGDGSDWGAAGRRFEIRRPDVPGETPAVATVRLAWDRAIAKGGGITVTEEAQNGSVTGPKLMGLADEIAEGRTDGAKALAEAAALIAGPEKMRPLALK